MIRNDEVQVGMTAIYRCGGGDFMVTVTEVERYKSGMRAGSVRAVWATGRKDGGRGLRFYAPRNGAQTFRSDIDLDDHLLVVGWER